MAYLLVSDFRQGLDVRRSQVSSASDVLFEAENVHVSRGGEIEKRLAFTDRGDLTGTVGLAATAYSLFVFGVGARPGTLPASIGYQNLAITPSSALTRILAWDVFSGNLYVSALYANGVVAHFYNGTRVADWVQPAGPPPPSQPTVRYAPILTASRKVYAGAANVLFFSAIDNPTRWQVLLPNAGEGFIDLSNTAGGAEQLVAFASYQNRLAVFSRRAVQIWDIDPDPALYRLRQVLPNLGTRAPRSVVNFGDADVFFLADTGVRSLRARDTANTAASSDIGTPIDPLIQEEMRLAPVNGAWAPAAIEPSSGRYWLALGSRIYVFSFFPSARVSAWSRYTLPWQPTDFASLENRIFARGADNRLYLYGGEDGVTYGNDYDCTVELALLDAKRPATHKMIEGLDVDCEGSWEVYFGSDPANPSFRELVATVNRTSYGVETLGLRGYGTHFSYRLRHRGAGYAGLFGLATHFSRGEES